MKRSVVVFSMLAPALAIAADVVPLIKPLKPRPVALCVQFVSDPRQTPNLKNALDETIKALQTPPRRIARWAEFSVANDCNRSNWTLEVSGVDGQWDYILNAPNGDFVSSAVAFSGIALKDYSGPVWMALARNLVVRWVKEFDTPETKRLLYSRLYRVSEQSANGIRVVNECGPCAILPLRVEDFEFLAGSTFTLYAADGRSSDTIVRGERRCARFGSRSGDEGPIVRPIDRPLPAKVTWSRFELTQFDDIQGLGCQHVEFAPLSSGPSPVPGDSTPPETTIPKPPPDSPSRAPATSTPPTGPQN